MDWLLEQSFRKPFRTGSRYLVKTSLPVAFFCASCAFCGHDVSIAALAARSLPSRDLAGVDIDLSVIPAFHGGDLERSEAVPGNHIPLSRRDRS